MSWVMAVEVSMFQTVQVVSIDEVTTKLGDFSFQEKLVNGAPTELFCTLLCYVTTGQYAVDQKWMVTRTPDSAALNVNR